MRMTTTLLERLLDLIGRVLTPEAAQQILQLRADDETQQRVDELAHKCNEGKLSADERAEYQSIVSWFNVLSVLQAKARTRLIRQA
jgi:hypothetical protein